MKIHNHLCFIIVKYILRNFKTDQLINLNESTVVKYFQILLILLIYVLNDTNGWFSVQNLRKN